tara:strand:- start:5140 stop:5331 length:192 start_codon:yes stop_codon:yes gene_type:complete
MITQAIEQRERIMSELFNKWADGFADMLLNELEIMYQGDAEKTLDVAHGLQKINEFCVRYLPL